MKALNDFQKEILAGIPDELPEVKPYDPNINHAPKRKDILTKAEKKLAIRNALRYFPAKFHATLAPEFAEELEKYGRIYMYRFRPSYKMYARPIEEYPAKCKQAAAIMLMIQNNLDPAVAQHPHELIIYGGNGAIFQNWAQYRLVMQYLANMDEDQTLAMYSGHPMGPHIMQEVEAICERAIIINKGVVVADDKIENLKQENAASNVVVVEFEVEVSESLLRGIPMVSQVRRVKGNHWIIEPQGDTDIRANLMKWSVERGLIIKTLQKEDLSIEEAFQKLTK